MSPSPRAIIHIVAKQKDNNSVNYSRRMYAVIRKYTPEVAQGKRNECFAELTGLRTFFKMTYKDLARTILCDLKKEIGISFRVGVTTVKAYEDAKYAHKKEKNISTYKELHKLFSPVAFLPHAHMTRKAPLYNKFTIPFLGKVS